MTNPVTEKNAAHALQSPLLTRIQFLLLGLGIALLPVALVLSHRAIGILVLAGGLICALSPGFWNTICRYAYFSPLRWNHRMLAGFIFGILCLWLAITSLWSPRSGAGTLFAIVLTPWLASCALIWWLNWCDTKSAVRIGKGFAYAIVIAAALLVFEALTGGMIRTITPPTDTSWNQHKDMIALGRGTTILVMLAFPAGLILYRITRSWISFAVLMALSAYPASAFGIAANLLGLMAGLVCFALALRAPRLTLQALVLITLIALAMMPLIAVNIPADTLNAQFVGKLPVSWLQRFYVWQTAGAAIVDGLPFGHGADYARYLAQFSPTIDIAGAYGPLQTIPTHPHNVFLQLWLEAGLPGVILTAALVIFGASAVLSSALDKQMMAGLAGLLAVVLVSFCVEASLWQLWRLASIAIGVAGVMVSARIQPISLRVS